MPLPYKGVIGKGPGTHRVRAYTKRTKSGFISVRQHTAANKVQTVGLSKMNKVVANYYAKGKPLGRLRASTIALQTEGRGRAQLKGLPRGVYKDIVKGSRQDRIQTLGTLKAKKSIAKKILGR
jgi:hypothetical protein